MEFPIITYPKNKDAVKMILEFLKENRVKFELSPSMNLKHFLELEKGRKEFKTGKTKKMTLSEVADFLQS